MIDKRCIHGGCKAYPCYGFGKPSGQMKWACAEHNAEIGFRTDAARAAPGRATAQVQAGGVSLALPAPIRTPVQGSLI